jgi:predicted TIM-barrel fold metal-dependent hydrolase
MPMPVVDAHHHLWDLNVLRYPWLESGGPLARNYLLDDYLADAAPHGVVKSVHLQAECDASDPVAETRWLQHIADKRGFPHGIVAFVSLEEERAGRLIDDHLLYRNVRGVRQILDSDPHQLLTDPCWRQGFALLGVRGLSFDMQVHPLQMPRAADLARSFPTTQVVLNHTGMPHQQDAAGIESWRRGMRLLAAEPNVAVKISGHGMFDGSWTSDSVRPIIVETIRLFGPWRCIFASNFPVDKPAAGFGRVLTAFQEAIAGFPDAEQRAMLHDNAVRIYRL